MDLWVAGAVLVVHPHHVYSVIKLVVLSVTAAPHTSACSFLIVWNKDVSLFGHRKQGHVWKAVCVCALPESMKSNIHMHRYSHIQSHTFTHIYGYGTFDEGVAAFAERLNTHGLFCFLSRCLPFFLHPSWWCWRWHWLCVRLCCVCTPLTACACLWLAFRHLWFDLAGVRLPLCGLPCHHVCVRACIYLFACLRVALWLPLPGQYFYFQEVLPVLAAKHCIMQANAELHQSVLAKQKKRFGEEIARLQVHSCTVLTEL